MDIILFGVFLAFALTAIGLDYYRNVAYMGIIGGIALILLGIFLTVDGSLTTLICPA